jgi:hypothetical protein
VINVAIEAGEVMFKHKPVSVKEILAAVEDVECCR